ncbi:hypothetical protein DFP72DRAFT_1146541 [Ephemerocybe angulata]|uniref:Uncharacterized protein n=1 Tax=Ephemerocybe angulata TaxID=980116 RepID=A0A8H6M0Z4_9AGAR|nr:hypothetical protein DFP72DRAFT_1146541 [Tulosesus angulatus]
MNPTASGEIADLSLYTSRKVRYCPAHSLLPVRALPLDFVGVLGDVHLDDSEASRGTVVKLLTTFLTNSRDLQVWLGADRNRYDAVPVGLVPHGIVKWITDSITTSPISVTERGNTEIVWRIGVRAFSTSQACMRAFCIHLKSLRIQALEISGVAKFKRNNWNCASCRGRDHPTGLCPLKSIPGFFDLDPNPHTTQPAPVVSAPPPQPDDDDDFIPGLHAAPNTNQSRGHFTTDHAARGSGRGAFRGRGSTRGHASARGGPRGRGSRN